MTNILITGASSGLGAALARTYAAAGVHLVLCGRQTERLAAVAEGCRTMGSSADEEVFDLREAEPVSARLSDIDRRGPLDLAIFNAGLGGPTPADSLVESAQRAAAIAAVNFTAVVAGASAVAEAMARRKGGRIVVIGSIGDAFPLPVAPAYSGAKAGVRLFAEALALQLRRHGVGVTLVSPGFIDTPMSRQINGPKPFMMTAEAAAAIIKRRVAKGADRVTFPLPLALLRGLFVCLPRPLRHAVMLRITA